MKAKTIYCHQDRETGLWGFIMKLKTETGSTTIESEKKFNSPGDAVRAAKAMRTMTKGKYA